MHMENMLTNNTAHLTGVIATEFEFSHQVYGEGFYTCLVEVTRLSAANDILPITVSERLINMETLAVGTLVAITGQVRSYNSYNEDSKRTKLMLTIFVREIEIYTALSDEGQARGPKAETESDFSQYQAERGVKGVPGPHNQSLNDIYLNGYICKQPIYRTTPFGREITDLLVAVNRSYNKSDYIPCIAWGRNARFAGKLSVSDNIRIWGRMQSRIYQKRLENGELEERTAYEISISKIETANSAESI